MPRRKPFILYYLHIAIELLLWYMVCSSINAWIVAPANGCQGGELERKTGGESNDDKKQASDRALGDRPDRRTGLAAGGRGGFDKEEGRR
jgi:hypothetical protein